MKYIHVYYEIFSLFYLIINHYYCNNKTNSMNASNIKQQALQRGAHVCGIGSIDRYTDAPQGFSPLGLFPQAQSVITFGMQIPKSTLSLPSFIPYTVTDSVVLSGTHRIGYELSLYIESKGFQAVMVPSEPYHYWDAPRMTGKGIVSLKHLAQRSGLGVIGRNQLLCNPSLGNLIKIGAVLTDAILEADALLTKSACPENCRLCISSCPSGALSETGVNQLKCRQQAEQHTTKGDDYYACNTCRKVCPNVSGFAFA